MSDPINGADVPEECDGEFGCPCPAHEEAREEYRLADVWVQPAE